MDDELNSKYNPPPTRKRRTLNAFFSNAALLVEFIEKPPDDQKGGYLMCEEFLREMLNIPPLRFCEKWDKKHF